MSRRTYGYQRQLQHRVILGMAVTLLCSTIPTTSAGSNSGWPPYVVQQFEKTQRFSELLPAVAAKIFDGKEVKLRVYDNASSTFRIVAVPLIGCDIEFDTLAEIAGDVQEDAIIIFAGTDQADPAFRTPVSRGMIPMRFIRGGKMNIFGRPTLGPPSSEKPDQAEILRTLELLNRYELALHELINRATRGTEIVLRAFKSKQSDPWTHERLKTVINGSAISVASGVRQGTILIAAVSEDQNDPALCAILKESLPLISDMTQRTTNLFSSTNVPSETQFCDALNQPIPNAEVELLVSTGGTYPQDDLNPTAAVCRLKCDENGWVRLPALNYMVYQVGFFVSHPDYGSAPVYMDKQPQSGPPLSRYKVPLVPKDSPQYAGAIRGVALDEDGQPLAGAAVLINHLTSPDGLVLSRRPPQNRLPRQWYTMADRQGCFTFYPILTEEQLKTLPSLSAKVDYDITVSAGAETMRVVYNGVVRAGGNHRLTLATRGMPQYSQAMRERSQSDGVSFVIENLDGEPITDVEKLKAITLTGSSWGGQAPGYDYETWSKGGRFPWGGYQGEALWDGKLILFTGGHLSDRNEQGVVTLRQKPMAYTPAKGPVENIIHRGTIIHGITGKPIPGAFLIRTGMNECDYMSLTDEQWQVLHSLDTHPERSDTRLDCLWDIRQIDQIVRVDGNGHFELSVPIAQKGGSFEIFEQGYLPLHVNREYIEKEHVAEIDLPPMRLYPAVRVTFTVKAAGEIHNMRYVWDLGDNDSLGWFEGFTQFWNDCWAPFPCQGEVEAGVPKTVLVPAGMDIQLRFIAFRGQGRGGQIAPRYSKTLNCEPDKTLDIGEIDLADTVHVMARAVDTAGHPRCNIPILICQTGYYGGSEQTMTNADGIAHFQVPYPYESRFIVQHRSLETGIDYHAAVEFTVDTKADADKVFTLELSDELLKQLGQ